MNATTTPGTAGATAPPTAQPTTESDVPGAGADPTPANGAGVGDGAVGAVARSVGVLVDIVWEVTELLAAAVAGALTGAAGAVAQVWVADRPRRQRVRHHRRRRWWARGGWRRAVVGAEIVAVFSALAALTALRIVAATGVIGAAGARGARAGWTSRRPYARSRTHARREKRWGAPSTARSPMDQPPTSESSSEGASGWSTRVRVDVVEEPVDVVQGDVVCAHRDPDTDQACSSVLPAGWYEPLCLQHLLAARRTETSTGPAAGGHAADRDDVVVDVEVVDGGATSEMGESPHSAGSVGEDQTPTRRADGCPETDSDRRFFDLRDAGYRGWIDQDGYPVAERGDGGAARRLTDEEVAAAVAGGDGHHHGPRLVPDVESDGSESEGSAHKAAEPPQSPDGHPASGSAEQNNQQNNQEAQMNDASVTATRGGERVAQVRTSGGTVSSTGLGGELAHVDDLDNEAATMAGVIEQAQVLAQTLQTWQRQLPDKAASALGTTRGITAAVTAVREAPSTSQLREALTALREEIKRGLEAGDRLAASGVSGEVAGVVPR